MKKTVLLILSVILVLPVLCAASANARTDVIIGEIGEPASFDPHINDKIVGIVINQNVYESLLALDEEGNVIPWLCESYEVSEDGTVYTFHLREGVKFQNGDPMTAEDVVYSLNKAAASPYCAEAADTIDHAEIIDEKTVKMVMKYAFMVQEQNLTTTYCAIVNKKIAEEKGELFGVDPGLSGTGPYKFESWNKGVEVVLSRNEEYWGNKPAMEKVTFRFYNDATAGDIAVETGEIDAFLNPSNYELALFESNENITVYSAASHYCESMALNTTYGPLSDVRVRQAISLCINREDVMIAGVGPTGGVTTGVFTAPSLFGSAYDLIPVPQKDTEKAKQLLAEAGYPNGFEITLMTVDGIRAKHAQVIQQALAEIGITATIDMNESNAFYDKMMKGEYQIGFHGFTTLTNDADTMTYLLFESSGIGVYNYAQYKNEEVDRLLRDSRTQLDKGIREKDFIEAQKIIADECPDIPLYLKTTNNIANSKLLGFKADPNNILKVTTLSWGE